MKGMSETTAPTRVSDSDDTSTRAYVTGATMAARPTDWESVWSAFVDAEMTGDEAAITRMAASIVAWDRPARSP